MTEQAVWIWYPGDMEMYQGMLQNFQREERGYGWTAFWKMGDWNKNVIFSRTYELDSPTTFTVHGHGTGYVDINGIKNPMEKELELRPGHNEIKVFIGDMSGLPCIYIDDDIVKTDGNWEVSDFINSLPAGTSSLYTAREQDPNGIYYKEETVEPYEILSKNGGTLFCFDRVINGPVTMHSADPGRVFAVCYGESVEEATDEEWCYYKEPAALSGQKLRRRAFRYLFVPGMHPEEITCTAIHQSLPIPVRSRFESSDETMNRIWNTARNTFDLCSGIFFIDGVKRDRWIWSGDAYQSYFINQYLYHDKEIEQRTIRALRGNLQIEQHINTIVDYSMLWLISIENHYMTYGDTEFIREMYPKMSAMMDFLESRLDEHGFIVGREYDWTFIDWADIDKEGPVAAEQMLLLKSYYTMCKCADILGLPSGVYSDKAKTLKKKIMECYWDDEKKAFIDSFASGKRNVTRHANIFAILYDLVDHETQEQLCDNVIRNENIPPITTPYFKFFEMDALGKLGYLDELYPMIKSYWGGMLDRGAVTFWEIFDPQEDGPEQYGMYDDPFGKSLCHAWGASPIYLLGRYFLGIRPTAPGYETYEVDPKTEYFNTLDCIMPVGKESISIQYRNGELKINKA